MFAGKGAALSCPPAGRGIAPPKPNGGFMLFTDPIRKNRDFKRVYSKGKCISGAVVVVYYLKNARLGSKNRLGITVSTKIGKAVVRNRVRRIIREAYRACESSISAGYDIVIVARGRACGLKSTDIAASLLEAFKGTPLLRKP